MLVSRAKSMIAELLNRRNLRFLQNSVFTAKEPPASSHMLVSWAEPIIARGSSFLLQNSVFPAKEAPASSHMLVSRAKPMIAELLKSKEPQGFFKTACLLRRNLLPVVICLSHGLSQSLLVVSSFLLKFLVNSVFSAPEPPASSHTLVSWAEPRIAWANPMIAGRKRLAFEMVRRNQ